ncbi:MAG: hypothetical protein WC087_03435 [Candidatus Paceibacterota bacterium]
MPRGESDEVEVIFFQVGRVLTHEDLAQEFNLRGLKPADSYSQAKANEDDPIFAEEHPNGTHWEHNGKWCFSTFDVWDGEQVVDVSCSGRGWLESWWFAGIRK